MSDVRSGKIIRCKVVIENDRGEQIRAWGGSRIHLSNADDTGKCLVVQKASHRKGAGTYFALRRMQHLHGRKVSEGMLSIETSHLQHKRCFIHITVKSEDREDLRDLFRIISRKEVWSQIGVRESSRGQEVAEEKEQEDAMSDGYLID